MRRLLTVATLLTLTLSAAAPVKKKSVAKKSSSSRKSSSKARPISRRPSVQMSPSSDRYKEIQEALAAKGYLKSPATGVWDQDSQEAMRKFQADQNLDANGKLTSRTLISLGLGPKS
jgi:peptidoglycan hydrolase-like protein with peptidoglycan-binding domain